MRRDRLAVLLALLLLGGCVQEWAVSINPPDEFLALCREHDGLEIYETAEDVEGVIYAYEAGCGRRCKATLRAGRYKFVEAEASVQSLRNLVPGPGTYRFTAEAPGHPNCKVFKTWHDAKLRDAGSRLTRIIGYENICIATWPIERLTVRYEEQHSDIISRERWYGTLNSRAERIVDRHDGSVLAEFQSHWIDTPNEPGGLNCPGHRPGWSIYSVLEPAEPQ